ncbi:MAG: hypothetical protein R6U20_00480 [Longimonas sp.]|uniref:hypothetical protein n=1 Tax=Longimonas sp. TaxID=2039626 RepID=UPI0039765A99
MMTPALPFNNDNAEGDKSMRTIPVPKRTWMDIADHAYTESRSVLEALSRMMICLSQQDEFKRETSPESTSNRAETETAGLRHMEAWPSNLLKDEIALQHEDPNVQENVRIQVERMEKLLDRLKGPDEMY